MHSLDSASEQWVELVRMLPQPLLLPQQKVVIEQLPFLSSHHSSPDQRVKIQRVPQVLVFGTAATALKVGPAKGNNRDPRIASPVHITF